MAETTVQVREEAKPTPRETTRSDDRYIAPPVDIYEDKEGLRVVADLPGAEPADIDVRIDQGVLTIQAKTHHLATGSPVYREFQLVSFFRQFQLPEKANVERISADVRNGVLKLWIPWAPEVQPRKVEVKVG
jgi:HSP20 family protein